MPAEAPAEPTAAWLRSLLERGQVTQHRAAQMLHVDERTMRRWCCGERAMPWSAAELLRRLIGEAG